MLLTKIMERRSCLLGLNSPVRVDAQLLIDGEQGRQPPTSTERIRAAIDRIRNVPKSNWRSRQRYRQDTARPQINNIINALQRWFGFLRVRHG